MPWLEIVKKNYTQAICNSKFILPFKKYFGRDKYTFAGQISFDLNIYSLDGKYIIIIGILLPKSFRPTVRKKLF